MKPKRKQPSPPIHAVRAAFCDHMRTQHVSMTPQDMVDLKRQGIDACDSHFTTFKAGIRFARSLYLKAP